MQWSDGFKRFATAAALVCPVLLGAGGHADEPSDVASAESVSFGSSGSACCSNTCAQNCCCNPCCERYEYPLGRGASSRDPLLSAWTWLGPTVTDVDSNSEWGLGYGATLGYRLAPAFGILGGVGVNHVDGGTQVLGTLGVQRFGNPYGRDALDRTTVWFLYDQFSQSGSGTDTDLGQFRYQLGYVFNDRFEAGASFTTRSTDKDNGAAITPIGGTNTLFPGQNFSGAYTTYRGERAELGFTLGHSDATDSVAGGVQVGIPVSGQRNGKVVVGASAADESFGGNLYYTIGLWRADTTRY